MPLGGLSDFAGHPGQPDSRSRVGEMGLSLVQSFGRKYIDRAAPRARPLFADATPILPHHFARHLLDRPQNDPRDRLPRHDGDRRTAVGIPGHQNCIILLRLRLHVAVGDQHAAAFQMDLDPAALVAGGPKLDEQRCQGMGRRPPRGPEGKSRIRPPLPRRRRAVSPARNRRLPGPGRDPGALPLGRVPGSATGGGLSKVISSSAESSARRGLRARGGFRFHFRFVDDRNAKSRAAFRTFARPTLQVGRSVKMMAVGTEELDLPLF